MWGRNAYCAFVVRSHLFTVKCNLHILAHGFILALICTSGETINTKFAK